MGPYVLRKQFNFFLKEKFHQTISTLDIKEKQDTIKQV